MGWNRLGLETLALIIVSNMAFHVYINSYIPIAFTIK